MYVIFPYIGTLLVYWLQVLGCYRLASVCGQQADQALKYDQLPLYSVYVRTCSSNFKLSLWNFHIPYMDMHDVNSSAYVCVHLSIVYLLVLKILHVHT